MKVYSTPLNRWTALLSAGCFLSLLFTSCLKTKNDYTPPPPVAYVAFFQASPDEQPLDLFFNNNKVNQLPLHYGDGIDYFQAYPGLRTVNLYNSGGTIVFSDTVRLTPNIAYSLFMVNTAAHRGLFLVTDSISRPATGKATLRFINVSPDAPAVDLAIKDSAAFVTNKAFKGFSSFIPKNGGQIYNFEIRQHGTNTVLATLNSVTLNNGLVYTVWLHGLANTTLPSDKLTADIVTNAYYY